jgi:hypothetical protein
MSSRIERDVLQKGVNGFTSTAQAGADINIARTNIYFNRSQ